MASSIQPQPQRHDSEVSTAQTSSDRSYQPRDIIATFNYYRDSEDGSPPEPTDVTKPQQIQREPISQQLKVFDIRGSEDQYTLDTTGFQIVKHSSVEKDFRDDDQIKSTYYPEMVELLKKTYFTSPVWLLN